MAGQRTRAATPEVDAPGLDADDLVALHRRMVRTRELETTAWNLVRQNQVDFAANSAGHEGVSAGWSAAAVPGTDFLAPHYREIPALLTLGLSPVTILATLFGNDKAIARGRQPYCYWGSVGHRILSASGPQPNHLTHGVGVAYASRLLREPEVTWITFGDGGASRGEFHEGLNFAAIHRVPAVFVCHNNGYTQAVALDRQAAHPDIARRAHGYDIPGVVVDGMDVLAVYRAAREARERAVAGEGPTLLEAKCYRFFANTSNDDDRRYRSGEEVAAWRERDPVPRFAAWLLAAGLVTEEELGAIREEEAQLVADALAEARAAPPPPPDEVWRHTYAGDGAA